MPPVLTADPRPASQGVVHGRPTSGVQFRRAVMLMLMTLVLPGSAQLVAGRKEVGRIALRVWLGLVVTMVLLFGLGMLFSSFVFWLLSNTFVLGLVRIVLIVLAVAWAFLFMDAWRLGDPLALRQKQRLAMVGINGVLCFGVAGSLLFASHVVGVQKDFMGAMFTDGQVSGAPTVASTCCSWVATPAMTAGGCDPTACRSPASTPRPARRCSSACRATC